MARTAVEPEPEVAVLAPEPLLMASVEGGGGRPGAGVRFRAGGQGVWVARMAAELGARTVLCAPLGGRAGRLIERLLEDEGVRPAPAECAGESAVWISTGREGDEPDVARTATPRLDRHEVDRLYNIMLSAALAAGTAVLTGVTDPGTLPAELYGRLTKDLVANGVTVVADVAPELVGEVAGAGVSALKLSHEELVRAGRARDGTRGEVAAGVGALREAGAEAVLVSRRAEPAIAHMGGALLEVTHPRLEELNPRGAGDAMTGALAAGLARGMASEEVLRLAVAAGSLNVTRRGLGTGERRAVEGLAALVSVSGLDDAAGGGGGPEPGG